MKSGDWRYYTDKRIVLNQLELILDEYLLNSAKVLFCDDMIQDIQLAIFTTTERTTFNDIQRHHGSETERVDLAETYIKNKFTGKLNSMDKRSGKKL